MALEKHPNPPPEYLAIFIPYLPSLPQILKVLQILKGTRVPLPPFWAPMWVECEKVLFYSYSP